ncbi:stage II sporulation protein M [Paenibacillus gansuensis]|uniref:Stage II sporulation protein M n=1 Tax=Paenibacillus gansuensis TaxID=306542 RepID=A0ABW5PK15_9BACL
MTSLQKSWDLCKENSVYIAFGTLLFLAGAALGGFSGIFSSYGEDQMQGIGELARQIESGPYARFVLFAVIFLNNTIKSILMMYLGLLFGVIPVLFLFINGVILGYVIQHAADQGADVIALVFKGILPHGIIELPVIIVAGSFGIRLGAMMWARTFNFIRAEAGGSRILREYMRDVLALAKWFTLLLLIAAFIESTITFWLLGR